jgi:hypothetical protein
LFLVATLLTDLPRLRALQLMQSDGLEGPIVRNHSPNQGPGVRALPARGQKALSSAKAPETRWSVQWQLSYFCQLPNRGFMLSGRPNEIAHGCPSIPRALKRRDLAPSNLARTLPKLILQVAPPYFVALFRRKFLSPFGRKIDAQLVVRPTGLVGLYSRNPSISRRFNPLFHGQAIDALEEFPRHEPQRGIGRALVGPRLATIPAVPIQSENEKTEPFRLPIRDGEESRLRSGEGYGGFVSSTDGAPP